MEWELEGHVVGGRGFLRYRWYMCVPMRNSGAGVMDQEHWVGSPEQKPLRPVGEDLAFPGGGHFLHVARVWVQVREGEGAGP